MKANITSVSVAGVNHIVVSGITVDFKKTREEIISQAKKGDGKERIFATITYTNDVFNKDMKEEHYFDITTGRAGTVVALRISDERSAFNQGGKLFTDIQIDK